MRVPARFAGVLQITSDCNVLYGKIVNLDGRNDGAVRRHGVKEALPSVSFHQELGHYNVQTWSWENTIVASLLFFVTCYSLVWEESE